jgi:hypothetical protein
MLPTDTIPVNGSFAHATLTNQTAGRGRVEPLADATVVHCLIATRSRQS